MSTSTYLSTAAATLTAAFTLSASILLSPMPAHAQEATGECSCPQRPAARSAKPKYADLNTSLDESDEIAVLGAVQIALSETADGATYVWHRRNGRISGSFQPTSSFKNAGGKVCRHLKVMLVSGAHSRTAEGIACRLDNGAWQLDG